MSATADHQPVGHDVGLQGPRQGLGRGPPHRSPTGVPLVARELRQQYFRLTEMQSAIGLVQLGKLHSWVERRRRSAAILRERLADIPALRVRGPDDVTRALPLLRLRARRAPARRLVARPHRRDRRGREACRACRAAAAGSTARAGVPGSWRPAAPLPVAAKLGRTAMALLVHPAFEDDDVAHAGDVVAEVLRRASR
ncbi:MAG: DegT/DnrJ/EryC1/StrS family aminotransferase [Nannocystaceae bacterium]